MSGKGPALIGALALVAIVATALGTTAGAKAQGQGTPTPPKPVGSKTPPSSPPATKKPPQPATAIPPQNVLDRIVAAVATQDPDKMRLLATDLDAEGWVLQADDLRRAADIATFLRAGGLKPPGTVMQGDAMRAPARPQPSTPLPGLVAPQLSPPELHPKRLQAQMLIREIEEHQHDTKEDRSLVAAFQANNGLKASGYYTPGTAICLAEQYGLVPPEPYWPTSGRVKAKANYVKRLRAIAARDPQRREEFERAAENIK